METLKNFYLMMKDYLFSPWQKGNWQQTITLLTASLATEKEFSSKDFSKYINYVEMNNQVLKQQNKSKYCETHGCYLCYSEALGIRHGMPLYP